MVDESNCRLQSKGEVVPFGGTGLDFFLYICKKNCIMATPSLFRQYIWLVNTINNAGKITFAEINRLWVGEEMSGGVEMARTTFNRHKDAVLDVFGVIIDCDRRNGYKYYISNRDVLDEVGNETTEVKRICVPIKVFIFNDVHYAIIWN